MESWKVKGIAGIIGIVHSKLPAFHISEKTWRDLNLNKKQGTFTKNVD